MDSVVQQEAYDGLDWLQPGQRELTLVESYIRDRASTLHPGLGGSSRLDISQGKFAIDVRPHQQIEQVLRLYISETLNIPVTKFDNALPDKIGALEKGYCDTKQGLFHKLWYNMGDKRDIVEAWLDVIPDSYGVCVVKAGIAVVFKLAENSTDKRDRVFKTFATFRDVLVSLSSDRARFRQDPNVSGSATSLYKAVVDAIEDMVLVMSAMEKSSFAKLTTTAKKKFSKSKSENETEKHRRPTLDTILEALDLHIAQYNGAINLARDRHIEQTKAYGHFNAIGIIRTHQNTVSLRQRFDEHAAAQKQQGEDGLEALRQGQQEMQVIQDGNYRIEESQVDLRNGVMRLILDVQRRNSILERLDNQLSLNSTRRRAVVNLDDLCHILAQPSSAQLDSPHDLRRVFQHPSVDLGQALAEQGRQSVKNQGHVQSLLSHDQFLHWLSHQHPSLILVDANIRESALASVSAISVLSSTLATSLMQAYADEAVVISFFCGMHASPADALYGPTGLIRSLMIQLLMKLDTTDPEMREWNLDFINDRVFVQNLERHSLPDLCSALHELLFQFKPNTPVYCIIDTISAFDAEHLSRDLEIVFGCLQRIIDDQSLVPIFKVLITNPGESTRVIKDMAVFREDPTRIISLGRQSRAAGRISARVVDEQLLRAPSPMRRRTPSPFRQSRQCSPAAGQPRYRVPHHPAYYQECGASLDGSNGGGTWSY
ncbi:uncharacterized protein B0H64DRAFT_398821 [Chaetomium fimeti]|uniref:Nephrocystin 3-like N-terminal domain-containing protein n=1 Tax=Chaetomium fimeti TaxID=1854472 RepID=A0AAE0HC94_9PEZI|nr:hypothetical protein B0H64DRAFT_398821 [Chaetomium fimeti]